WRARSVDFSARFWRSGALKSLAFEDRLALLDERALRFLGVLCARERDRHGLLETVAVARRHLLDHVERALHLAHRDRAFRRDLARDLHRLVHQLLAWHA